MDAVAMVFLSRGIVPCMAIRIPVPASLVLALVVLFILFIVPFLIFSYLGRILLRNPRTRRFGKYFIDTGNKVVMVIVFYLLAGLAVWLSGISLPRLW